MPNALRHLLGDSPRVMVVDGSRLMRTLITQVIVRAMPGAEVMACASLRQAQATLPLGDFQLITTSLILPDGSGMALADSVREVHRLRRVPVIAVSGDVQEHLEERRFSDAITDYFDKSLGYEALVTFIQGYVQPKLMPGARVLYVEDSRVVAEATRRMLERHAIQVVHVTRAEDAFALLTAESLTTAASGYRAVLTDLTLKGELSGHDLVQRIRIDFGYDKWRLPILVMTGESNRDHQAALLQAGANDLVVKPIEERLLMTKLLYQLRLAQIKRAQKHA